MDVSGLSRRYERPVINSHHCPCTEHSASIYVMPMDPGLVSPSRIREKEGNR
jgi:hypothetical protein